MPTYLRARWRNEPAGCPLEIFSELDHTRRETRKVEVFAGGALHHAGPQGGSHGPTRLADEPLPTLAEIAQDLQFDVDAISATEFEAAWTRARG